MCTPISYLYNHGAGRVQFGTHHGNHLAKVVLPRTWSVEIPETARSLELWKKALGMWHMVSLTNQLSSLTCADSRSELNMQKKLLHRGEAD